MQPFLDFLWGLLGWTTLLVFKTMIEVLWHLKGLNSKLACKLVYGQTVDGEQPKGASTVSSVVYSVVPGF